MRDQIAEFTAQPLNGVRVVLVMNRKGGAGKSTLCRALASAAVARGETVTLFDTDASRSCHAWMERGKAAGNWSPLIEVIHSLDADRILDAVARIHDQPDQEHLILIDTFGGASEAQDHLATAAHQIVCPMMLSRSDVTEARATAAWYLGLRGRVSDANALPPFTVALSRVPLRVSESERAVASDLFATLPTFDAFLGNRSGYLRMDEAGLLGGLTARLPNRGAAAHLLGALREAEALLAEIDAAIRTRGAQPDAVPS